MLLTQMMHKSLSISLLLLIMIISSCFSGDIVIANFESGTFDKWTVKGEAFGDKPAEGSYSGQMEVTGFEGNYLANSFFGGDNSVGTLTSNEFTIERNYINFLIGGGKHDDIYMELLVDGKSAIKSRSVEESETLQWETWDVRKFKGRKAIIKIVDNQRGGWGHILIDEICQSNTKKSVFLSDHTIEFDITGNYILIPVEDSDPELVVQISVDGKKMGEPINIRVSQTKIGYWVPIDMSKYKGRKMSLTFEHVKETNIGLSQIKQSDSFEFDYNETYRPLYHFTPNHGWINDPNGMVYDNGEYHLFYQYNPYGSRWANMHWGHAVSKDMISWEHLPFALTPDSLGAIFSGSAVIDKGNTAGFGKGAMVAIYTSAGRIQTQSVAYSLDSGRTFTKYKGNPVLSDLNYPDFRDPKVFWHNSTNRWIMALATGQTISFYCSNNLKEWNKLSEFGEGIGEHSGVWECPDLFPLKYNGQTKWVLFVSINPGGPNGGSATQYFIGDFDGKTFKPDTLPYPLWLDYGRDNYAGVTWNNIPEYDGRKLFIGWMNNWDYANYIPPVNFKGAMTLPRELKLAYNGKHLIVANSPIEEIKALRVNAKRIDAFTVNESHKIDNLTGGNTGSFEIEMDIEVGTASYFNFILTNERGENTMFNFDLEKGVFSVDRSKSGIVDFSDQFAAKVSKAPLTKKKSYNIRLFVDKSSTECFINNGEVVQTNSVFPTASYNSLSFESDGKVMIRNMNVYSIQSK
jgi:fructan beta-fructosidase